MYVRERRRQKVSFIRFILFFFHKTDFLLFSSYHLVFFFVAHVKSYIIIVMAIPKVYKIVARICMKFSFADFAIFFNSFFVDDDNQVQAICRTFMCELKISREKKVGEIPMQQ